MMGELCTEPGETKISYGTAAMLDMNVGGTPVWPTGGTYPLVLWKRDDALTYCLEATAITAGAAITWLRDGLGLIATPADADRVAASVPDSGGVWAVPALQGLGTPYFDSTARAVLGGLSRGATRAHVVRAMLDGIAWRCREAFDALVVDAPRRPEALRANGGAARSDVLLQAEADALGIPVERAAVLEAAVLGAAHLAGLATGVWSDVGELRARRTVARVFEPRIGTDERESRFATWQRHVDAARHES
jgi:glycerol kinase